MGLESGTTIASLNASWPLGSDPKSQGDDHIRLVKGVMKQDVVGKTGNHTMAGALTTGNPLRVNYAPPGPQGGAQVVVGGYGSSDTALLSLRTAADAIIAELRTSFAAGIDPMLTMVSNTAEVLRILPSQGIQLNMGAQTGAANVTAVWDGVSRHTVRVVSSQASEKRDIRPIEDGLAAVAAMKPITYRPASADEPDREWPGFTVEDMEAAGLDALVIDSGPDLPRGLAYDRVTAYLAAAVQELAAEVTALRAALDALKAG